MNLEHERDSKGGPGEREQWMIVAEVRAPVGLVEDGQQEARKVGQAVTQKENHGHDSRNGFEIREEEKGNREERSKD